MGFFYRFQYNEISKKLNILEEKYKLIWNKYVNSSNEKPFEETIQELSNVYAKLEQLHSEYDAGFSKLHELERRCRFACEQVSRMCSNIKDDMYEAEYKFSPEFLVEFWANGNSIPLYEDGYDEDYSEENHYNAKASPKGYGKEVSFEFAPYKSRINLNDDTKTNTSPNVNNGKTETDTL